MTGVLFLDKDTGMTSFSAVRAVSRLTGEKKAGHTGTLDPLATGVLVVMLGRATGFARFMPEEYKTYKAGMRLGISTDTLDITGTVTDTADASHTDPLQAAAVCASFAGESMQVPPMYSAISKNGVKLYKLARMGQEVQREPRAVKIFSIDLRGPFNGTDYELNVTCTPGTYIRSLIDDIGNKLGCGACMTSLRRISSNGADIGDCATLESLGSGDASSFVRPLESCLRFPCVTVTGPQSVRFSNGGGLDASRLDNTYNSGLYKVRSPQGDFLGIGRMDQSLQTLFPEKIFVPQ